MDSNIQISFSEITMFVKDRSEHYKKYVKTQLICSIPKY